MLRKLLAFLAILAGCCTSNLAVAQAPPMQLGSFMIGAPQHCGGHSFCGQVGSGALEKEGLNISKSSDSLIWGLGSNVSVMVYCLPWGNENSFAIVVASSPSSSIAEQFRNNVRSRMQTTGCL
jgi:hypothetical protein